MPGYFVLLVDINDHDRYPEYARAVPPTCARYGGHMAIRGPVAEVIEGALEVKQDTRLVILAFETADQVPPQVGPADRPGPGHRAGRGAAPP